MAIQPTLARPKQGIAYALLAAIFFGSSTVFAKKLLADFHPVLLAGTFYLGSGIGLGTYWLARTFVSRPEKGAVLPPKRLPWLACAILTGGVLGPMLFMTGLRSTPASTVSLLLNLEGVFTAGLAWFAFHEHFDRRIASGMLLIILGGLVLSGTDWSALGACWGALAVVAACACWGLDNNFTRNVSDADPIAIAALKGFFAGAVNLATGLYLSTQLPEVGMFLAAGCIGLMGYGVSLVLFVLALRHIGTSRTGAYFSIGPFIGAAFSILLLREPVSLLFLGAALLMGLGIWLHLTEHHGHFHIHEIYTHIHQHIHDDHHEHVHETLTHLETPHAHEHTHIRLGHLHPHFPDIHHRHRHERP